MSLHRVWMLSVASLLVVGTLGLGDKPESVADEVMQSSPRPEFGRDAAIAAIEKLGGRCKSDEESPDRSIVRVYLTGYRISDADLEHLQGLTRLELLHLNGTQVTDDGLKHLKGMTSLRNLHVWNTRVTDDGVKKLQEALPNCKARLGTDHL